MFRRGISLLLIAGVLTGQVAVVPHAHGGMSAVEEREHAASPHFHWAWFHHRPTAHHESAAKKGPTAISHRHADSPASEVRHRLTSMSGQDRPMHDVDAVFVPATQKAYSNHDTRQQASTFQFDQQIKFAVVDNEARCTAATRAHWDPPDEVLDASGSYLTLRNLRI